MDFRRLQFGAPGTRISDQLTALVRALLRCDHAADCRTPTGCVIFAESTPEKASVLGPMIDVYRNETGVAGLLEP